MTAAVILRLVEAGVLSLDDHPQAHLGWWTGDPNDPRSAITIRQLLSFTSGFRGRPLGPLAPPCITDGGTTIVACAQQIYADEFVDEPGTTYYYGPSHMQILAAIAEAATGQAWSDIFQAQLATPLGMTATVYRYPSLTNPRASGGADISADDFDAFLAAMLSRELFPTTWKAMAADATPNGQVQLLYSPIESLNYEWHFGLGVWRECQQASWQPACDPVGILSITGALGMHGWIDSPGDFYGMIATEGGLGSSDVSVMLALSVRPLIRTALGK